MEKRFKFESKSPYTLHDSVITKLKIKDNNVVLVFEDGIYDPSDPGFFLSGSVTLEDVDMDFCDIMVAGISKKNKKFKGKDYTFSKFIKKFPEFKFFVCDTLWGYNMFVLTGSLADPETDKVYDSVITINYNGEVVFKTK